MSELNKDDPVSEGGRQEGSYKKQLEKVILFIGPESDHWLCLSLTHGLTILLLRLGEVMKLNFGRKILNLEFDQDLCKNLFLW